MSRNDCLKNENSKDVIIDIQHVTLGFESASLLGVADQSSVVIRFRGLGKEGFGHFGCGCHGISGPSVRLCHQKQRV